MFLPDGDNNLMNQIIINEKNTYTIQTHVRQCVERDKILENQFPYRLLLGDLSSRRRMAYPYGISLIPNKRVYDGSSNSGM